jgi:molybdopterin molybdotransferase
MKLMPVAEVQARILSGVEPLSAEMVSIYDACGRVLADALKANLTQPPFDASAMDGFAVRAADIGTLPAVLKVIGRSAAGHGFSGIAGPREAVRIFTGAPLPSGTDTIVIQEDTKAAGENLVQILEGAPLGKHVRPRGYDFKEGDALLAGGTKLQSRHLMLAAAMNHGVIPVRRKPIVAVLANGDELVPPGCDPGPDQIISSIPPALKAAITAWGGKPLLLQIALDRNESLAARIQEAEHADILLTIGGASVGDHDLVRGVLEDAGALFDVLKAAMRPGKPVMFGKKANQRVLSLPGNPASAIICALVFLKPLLGRLLGLAGHESFEKMPLAEPIAANGEREHYMRALITESGVAPIADQDSSLMNGFSRADCLIVRPVDAPALGKGSLVSVLPLDF